MQDLKKKLYQQGQELKMNKACPLCQFKCVADHILKAHMLRKHTSKGTIHILRKHLNRTKFNLTTYFLRHYILTKFSLCTTDCETEIRFRYREPKPRFNFGICFGAEFFFSETEKKI